MKVDEMNHFIAVGMQHTNLIVSDGISQLSLLTASRKMGKKFIDILLASCTTLNSSVTHSSYPPFLNQSRLITSRPCSFKLIATNSSCSCFLPDFFYELQGPANVHDIHDTGKSRSGDDQGNVNAVRVTALMLYPMLVLEYAGALATTVEVGGNSGWRLGVKYQPWEVLQGHLKINDTLYFKYPQGQYNVVRLTVIDFDHCDPRRPLVPPMTTGEDHFLLTEYGMFYFICSIRDYCSRGMKVTIRVSKSK